MKLFFDQIASDYGIVVTVVLPPDFPFNGTEDFDDAVAALIARLNKALGEARVSLLPGDDDEDDDDDEEPGTELLDELDGLDDA